MTGKRSRARTDPELLEQLDVAHLERRPVEAVLRLKPADGAGEEVSPERAEVLTREVLARVKKRVGVGPKDFNIFRNLGSFAVSADPVFVRELLKQPEIAAATANRSKEDIRIPLPPGRQRTGRKR